MTTINEISVFFPAFNEAESIRDTVEKAEAVLKDIAQTYEIIVVVDGSTDETPRITAELASQNPNVRVIKHSENLGYGNALRSGFYGSKYELIAFTDGDGQFDFRELTRLVEKIDETDMVIGYRIKRMDPPMRLLNAWGWKNLIKLFFGLHVRDVDCAFKLIHRRVLDGIPKLESTRGGMISPELMIKATRFGFSFIQIGVHHYPRKAGKATGASPKVIVTSLYELVKLWFKMRQYPKLAGSLSKHT